MENNTNNNSLTRLELSDALVREVGLSRHESMQLVDDVLDHLSNSLALGENVKISSAFVLEVKQITSPMKKIENENVIFFFI